MGGFFSERIDKKGWREILAFSSLNPLFHFPPSHAAALFMHVEERCCCMKRNDLSTSQLPRKKVETNKKRKGEIAKKTVFCRTWERRFLFQALHRTEKKMRHVTSIYEKVFLLLRLFLPHLFSGKPSEGRKRRRKKKKPDSLNCIGSKELSSSLF